ILAASLISCTLLNAQSMKWYSMNEALELNKKAPRKMFIDLYTDWCGWCKVYDRKTFSNPAIAKYMNENYYAIKFNAEGHDTITFRGETFVNGGAKTRSTHLFAVALLNGKMSYPSVIFINEKSELLHIMSGFKTPPEFAPFMVYFGEGKYENTKWEDFTKVFKWEESSTK
ncbi:MAG: thioredoxin family protein, partial [Bacteroidales bacterium]